MNKNKLGLTLIEVLVSISVFSLVFGAIVLSINYIYKSQSRQVENIKTLSEMQRGIDYMVDAIRSAKYSDVGDYLIDSISQNSITIYSNVDNDVSVEKVRFFLENNIIKMNIYEVLPGTLKYYGSFPDRIYYLVYNVDNDTSEPIFRYFDEYGNEILNFNDVLKVRRVDIEIISKGISNEKKHVLQSSATLRNIR